MFVMMHFPPICIGIQDFSWLGGFHNSMWVLEKKNWDTIFKIAFKGHSGEKEADFCKGVLSPCSVFCHHITRFLKGAESVGHWHISLQRAASFAYPPCLTKLASHGSVSPLPSHPLSASADSPLKMCFVTQGSPKGLTPSVLCNKNLCCS